MVGSEPWPGSVTHTAGEHAAVVALSRAAGSSGWCGTCVGSTLHRRKVLRAINRQHWQVGGNYMLRR